MSEKISTLVCEDASHLGGPMGSEYTTFVFSKPFGSVESAKKYAVKYQKGGFPTWAGWKKSGRNRIVCDSGAYIWTITTQEVGK